MWGAWQSEVGLNSSGVALLPVPQCVLTLHPAVVLEALALPVGTKAIAQRALGSAGLRGARQRWGEAPIGNSDQ